MTRKERPLLEAFSEMAEAAVDFALSNEAVAAVPIVGPAFKMVQALDDYRARILQIKIERFLSEPSLRAAAEAREFREDLLVDEELNQQTSETLLMVLDKVTDMAKPTLLAKAFAAYLDGEIEREALLMLIHVVDVSFILDLQAFIRNRGANVDNKTLWRERLASSGLLRTYVTGALGGSDVEYELAPLGSCLLNVIEHCERLSADRAAEN